MALSRATLAALFQATVTSSLLINQLIKKIHFLYSKHEAIILSNNAVFPSKTEICLVQDLFILTNFSGRKLTLTQNFDFCL
jgi:hypothetical protein